MKKQILFATLVAGVLFAGWATPASAQAGTGTIEFFGGITFIGAEVELPCLDVCIPEGGGGSIPDLKADFDDDTPAFGVAGGYRVSDRFGFGVSLSWIDGDNTLGAPWEGSPLEVDLFFVDLSFAYFPGGKSFYIYGGPGLADIEARATIQSVTIPEQPSVAVDLNGSESTASVHFGIGKRFNFGEKGFVRIQSKARMIDSDVYDDVNIESTIGIGFKVGG